VGRDLCVADDIVDDAGCFPPYMAIYSDPVLKIPAKEGYHTQGAINPRFNIATMAVYDAQCLPLGKLCTTKAPAEHFSSKNNSAQSSHFELIRLFYHLNEIHTVSHVNQTNACEKMFPKMSTDSLVPWLLRQAMFGLHLVVSRSMLFQTIIGSRSSLR